MISNTQKYSYEAPEMKIFDIFTEQSILKLSGDDFGGDGTDGFGYIDDED